MKETIQQILSKIQQADFVLIGASNGLDISEGFNMFLGDCRFMQYFSDFHRKYGISSIFRGFFYPFPTDAEKWAFFSRVINTNLYSIQPSQLMKNLYTLVQNKPHFVITSNVNDHFALAGFDRKNIFEVEGSYQGIQCARGCHNTVYPNRELIIEMANRQKDCKVPEYLLPQCPKCGGPMQAHIAIDKNFIQGQSWEEQCQSYQKFVQDIHEKKLVILEFGIGYRNQVIKAPFMRLAYNEPHATYITFNKNELYIPNEIAEKSIGVKNDIGEALEELINFHNSGMYIQRK